MIYFCADDYGIAETCNNRIETCLLKGALNKVSILPNGCLDADFKRRLLQKNAKLALHVNLVEGYPLSNPQDVPLLINAQGCFRYSFIGLFFKSLGRQRKALKAQLYTEIKNQIVFWSRQVGQEVPICIDSHQHTHMIPLVFRTLVQVLQDHKVQVEYLRIPAEPVRPYILAPSLYARYSVSGLVKQWLLKGLGLVNRHTLKKSKFRFGYFIGVLFSGDVTGDKLQKVLPRYVKIAEKRNMPIEIGLHPGYLEKGERLMDGCRKSFEAFYLSAGRKKEYETAMHFCLKNKS